MLATAQVHAMLALAAATALVDIGRIEVDAWRAVAGTRLADWAAPGWLVLACWGRPARTCKAIGQVMTARSPLAVIAD